MQLHFVFSSVTPEPQCGAGNRAEASGQKTQAMLSRRSEIKVSASAISCVIVGL